MEKLFTGLHSVLLLTNDNFFEYNSYICDKLWHYVYSTRSDNNFRFCESPSDLRQ